MIKCNKNKINFSILEIAMILLCISVTASMSQHSIIAAIVGLIWIIPVYFIRWQSDYDTLIDTYDKKMITAFVVVFLVYMIIQFSWNFFMPDHVYRKLGIIHLISTLPIFLAYLFKVKLSDFNWNISFRNIVLVFIMFFLLREMPIYFVVGKGKEILLTIFSLKFVKNFGIHLLYPSIVEEVIFRGFLLTGLVSFGVKDDLSNIIQAFIFGLIHVIGKGDLSLSIIMSCFVQIYIGFIFGKIYLNTKSLTPTILLHALYDAL